MRNRSMTASHFRSILKFSVNKNKTFIQKGIRHSKKGNSTKIIPTFAPKESHIEQ